MTNLMSRLERLERMAPVKRPRFIWLEQEQTEAEVLSKAGPLADGEYPMFAHWQWR